MISKNLKEYIGNVSQTDRKSRIEYYYDAFGRSVKEEESFYTNSQETDSVKFAFEMEYDELGRIAKRIYPNSFEVEYYYNPYGDLRIMRSEGKTLWECESVNSLGQITSYSMGNLESETSYDDFGELEWMDLSGIKRLNYGFDGLGNLTSREDANRNLKEEFVYDDMNRLEQIKYYENNLLQSDGGLQIEYDLAGYGNMSNKSDVGDFAYGEDGAGPHALTNIDANGTYTPRNQEVLYTAFNKVSSITDTIDANHRLSYDLYYGIDNQRRQSVFTDTRDLSQSRTKYYFGDYEEEHIGDTVITYSYVHAPSGFCAVKYNQRLKNDSTSDITSELWHVNTDHLGSPLLYINADDNTNTKEYSYTAWGVRRNPTDWTLSDNSTLFTGRGYTFHEHLLDFALIDMNGRVYDPVLARFLSPDPYVQMPGMRSGFNRYSYCLNNPLVYTDPDGELIWVIPNIGWSRDGGFSLGVSVVVGLPGIWSAQTGVGYNFGTSETGGSAYGYVGVTAAMVTASASYSTSGGFSAGVSAGATIFSGLPVSTNFASVGVNYNFTNNSLSGNLSAWQIDQNGVRFNPSFSVMLFPEQTTNLVRGKGFISNDQVLLNYKAGDYKLKDNSTWQDAALDYFGFEGKYDGSLTSKRYQTEPGSYWGATNKNTGNISYGNLAFDNYSTLLGTYIKESYTARNIRNGNYHKLPEEYQGIGMDTYLEETHGFVHFYKNQGLFRGFKQPLQGIEYYQSNLSNFGIPYPTYPTNMTWIYRIPRLW